MPHRRTASREKAPADSRDLSKLSREALEREAAQLRMRLATSIESEQSLREQNRRLTRLLPDVDSVKLNKFNRALVFLSAPHAEMELPDAMARITETAADALRIARVSVWLFDEKKDKIVCADLFERRTSRHSAGLELEIEKYPAYFAALAEQRMIAADDATLDPRTCEFRENYLLPLGISSMLDAPVRGDSGQIGVFCIEHVGESRRWTYEEQQFAASVADMIALEVQVFERRRAEEALRRSEKELNDFFDNGAIGMHWVDSRGIVIRANRAELALLGYSESEYVGRHISDFHADASVIEHMLKQLACGETLRNHPARLKCRDGSIREVLIDSNGFWEDGRFVHSRCFTRDVTDMRRYERKIALQYEIAELLSTAHSLEGVAHKILAAIGNALGWDVGTLWMPDEVFQALKCIEFWARDDAEAASFREETKSKRFERGIDLPGRVWMGGKPIWFEDMVRETAFTRKTGARAMGLRTAFVFPFEINGEVLGVAEFFSVYNARPDDVRFSTISAVGRQIAQFLERKRAEEGLRKVALELTESNRELEQFAYVASHDLQEPLRKILLLCDRLKTQLWGIGDAEMDYFDRMQAAARRMKSLIEDLLNFSRVTAAPRAFESMDLGAALADAMQDLEGRLSQTGAQVTAGPMPRVMANPLLMKQLFLNLIGNAVKFSKDGVAPTVRITARPAGRRIVEILVEDDGIGFDEKYLDRIFKPFQRLHAKNGQYEGSGIGLAICQKIVNFHGGELTAESRPDHGSTFRFTLPSID